MGDGIHVVSVAIILAKLSKMGKDGQNIPDYMNRNITIKSSVKATSGE